MYNRMEYQPEVYDENVIKKYAIGDIFELNTSDDSPAKLFYI